MTNVPVVVGIGAGVLAGALSSTLLGSGLHDREVTADGMQKVLDAKVKAGDITVGQQRTEQKHIDGVRPPMTMTGITAAIGGAAVIVGGGGSWLASAMRQSDQMLQSMSRGGGGAELPKSWIELNGRTIAAAGAGLLVGALVGAAIHHFQDN